MVATATFSGVPLVCVDNPGMGSSMHAAAYALERKFELDTSPQRTQAWVEGRNHHGDIFIKTSFPSTYGHSQLKTGHPVRSAIHKQLNGRLVLRWVTTWESLLLYVLHFLLHHLPLSASVVLLPRV